MSKLRKFRETAREQTDGLKEELARDRKNIYQGVEDLGTEIREREEALKVEYQAVKDAGVDEVENAKKRATEIEQEAERKQSRLKLSLQRSEKRCVLRWKSCVKCAKK